MARTFIRGDAGAGPPPRAASSPPAIAALDHYALRVWHLLVKAEPLIVIDGWVIDSGTLALLVDRAASAEEFDPEPPDDDEMAVA